MASIDIQDTLKRDISFEALVDDMDSPMGCACEYADIENWNEYCGLTQTFTLYATDKDEMEEKTINLITDIENKAKNRVISSDLDGNITVNGFDFEALKRRKKTHYDVVTSWGGESKSLSCFVTGAVQSNYLEFEDEETGQEMVLFFDTYNDVFGDMTDEDKEAYAEDFALNEEAVKYGLEDEKAYGEITILTKDFATLFFNFED